MLIMMCNVIVTFYDMTVEKTAYSISYKPWIT